MKLFRIILLLFFIHLFLGCDPSIINPDSYGKKWKNTFLWFNPDNLETIYVSKNGDPDSAVESKNNTDYTLSWSTTGDTYDLSFSSKNHPIHFAFFDGYPVESINEEIPWLKDDGKFHLSSERLLPPANGLYRIMLSEDLTK
ncbi:hypothetical protein APR41_11430 [Salegentibacter salinarum]|uniref:Lipocalin-like domain-containing protein n=1 Tax=Salegentibacter salinarum TaxID=447422 RepID=A0A2N0TMC0_9FLAO|nr:hypothetical protein [Salegentibacter salinarum]PKD15885.1 hypothetical protein APR41_11430 [Salegentibacter salinarum]SKB72130.1 hypothetical protein SAMN05660903_02222 [Salegentibacter salinarum]